MPTRRWCAPSSSVISRGSTARSSWSTRGSPRCRPGSGGRSRMRCQASLVSPRPRHSLEQSFSSARRSHHVCRHQGRSLASTRAMTGWKPFGAAEAMAASGPNMPVPTIDVVALSWRCAPRARRRLRVAGRSCRRSWARPRPVSAPTARPSMARPKLRPFRATCPPTLRNCSTAAFAAFPAPLPSSRFPLPALPAAAPGAHGQ